MNQLPHCFFQFITWFVTQTIHISMKPIFILITIKQRLEIEKVSRFSSVVPVNSLRQFGAYSTFGI